MIQPEIYILVKEMRDAQNIWYRTRLKKDREVVDKLQKKVDKYIENRLEKSKNNNVPEISIKGMKIYIRKIIEIEKMRNYSMLFIQLGFNIHTQKLNNTLLYKLYDKEGCFITKIGNRRLVNFLETLGYEVIFK